MASVYLSCACVVVASLLLGAALMHACGQKITWVAGPVGNAALLVLMAIAIRLPGAWITALVVVIAAVICALVVLRSERPSARSMIEAGLVAIAVLALLSLPFLVAGHYGPLGVIVDPDLGFHVAFAERLHSGGGPALWPGVYPTGLEALAGVFSGSLHGAEEALIGAAVAAPVLSALAALTLLGRAPLGIRLLGACAVGLPYLSASFLSEASLKEPEMSVLVLGLALASANARGPRGLRSAAAIPLLVLAAGAYLVLGTGGLIYPIAIVGARLLMGPARRLPALLGDPRTRRVVVASGLLLCVVVVGGAYAIRSGALPFAIGSRDPRPGGNFARELPLTEMFGVWLGRDFRFPAESSLLAPALIVLALAVFAAGVIAQIRARDETLLVPLVAVLAIVIGAHFTVIAYDSGKAMVIAGPLIVLSALAPLAAPLRIRVLSRAALAGDGAIVLLALAVLWTGSYALRYAGVDSWTFEDQLAAFAPTVGQNTALFLGVDDWLLADLPHARLAGAHRYAVHALPVPAPPQKGKTPPFDFDTEPAAGLNRFRFVITSGTLDQSQPPANFRPVRATADFILWQRNGPTQPRQVLDEHSQPGAVLDCHSGLGAQLAGDAGVAAIEPPPQFASAWQAFGLPLAMFGGYGYSGPSSVVTAVLRVPPGRWQLSLDYQSPATFELSAGPRRFTLPARLEPLGQLNPVGYVDSTGAPIAIRYVTPGSPLTDGLTGVLSHPPVAVRAGQRDRLVPLREACGRYLDWYRVTG
jgi:hypothetical protein